MAFTLDDLNKACELAGVTTVEQLAAVLGMGAAVKAKNDAVEAAVAKVQEIAAALDAAKQEAIAAGKQL